MTQHVLVFHDRPEPRALLTAVCEDAGYLVTSVATPEDALMVLCTALHPVVAIVDRDRSSLHPDGPFFQIIHDQPDAYRQHRYIALSARQVSDADRAVLHALDVPLLRIPYSMDDLLALVAQAVASLI